jgi:hypothetical protein
MSPTAVARQLLAGSVATHLLYVMAELGLADLLADHPRTSAQLAASSDTNADALQRVLRGLAMLGVVARLADGRYALTPVGACLRSGVPGSLQPLARLVGAPVIQQAWSSLQHTVQTGQPAFDRALGFDFGQWLDTDPDGAERFHSMMGEITDRVAAGIAAGYDFSGVSSVVDVGGGTGSLVRAILRANPQVRGTIVDLPHARGLAHHGIAVDRLGDRCNFLAGDFFESVPDNADVYVLKSVLQEWDDARAVAILTTCRRAMTPTSRLLVVEGQGQGETDLALGDLLLLVMSGGRERTLEEQRALLHRANLHVHREMLTSEGPTILEAAPLST